MYVCLEESFCTFSKVHFGFSFCQLKNKKNGNPVCMSRSSNFFLVVVVFVLWELWLNEFLDHLYTSGFWEVCFVLDNRTASSCFTGTISGVVYKLWRIGNWFGRRQTIWEKCQIFRSISLSTSLVKTPSMTNFIIVIESWPWSWTCHYWCPQRIQSKKKNQIFKFSLVFHSFRQNFKASHKRFSQLFSLKW